MSLEDIRKKYGLDDSGKRIDPLESIQKEYGLTPEGKRPTISQQAEGTWLEGADFGRLPSGLKVGSITPAAGVELDTSIGPKDSTFAGAITANKKGVKTVGDVLASPTVDISKLFKPKTTPALVLHNPSILPDISRPISERQEEYNMGKLREASEGLRNSWTIPGIRNEQGKIPYTGAGNIDLNARPTLRNEDGSFSTIDSFSAYDERKGKEVLLPTVIKVGGEWKHVSEDEAWAHYERTGEHLGYFDTPEEANEYAQRLHVEQAKQYGPKLGPTAEGANAIEAKALLRQFEIAKDKSKAEGEVHGALTPATTTKDAEMDDYLKTIEGNAKAAVVRNYGDSQFKTDANYTVERGVVSITKAVEDTIDYIASLSHAWLRTQQAQNANDLAVFGAMTGNEELVETAVKQQEAALKTQMQDVANFGTRFTQQVENKYAGRVSDAGKIAGNISSMIGYMVPSIVTSMLTAGLGASAQVASNAARITMASSVAGGAAEEAKAAGASDDRALIRGTASGIMAYIVEGLAGGIKWFGKGTLDDGAQRLITKILKNESAQYTALKLYSFLGEGVEEFIEEVAGRLTTELTVDLGTDTNMDNRGVLETLGDGAESFLYGVIVSGILQMGGNVVTPEQFSDPKGLADEVAQYVQEQVEQYTTLSSLAKKTGGETQAMVELLFKAKDFDQNSESWKLGNDLWNALYSRIEETAKDASKASTVRSFWQENKHLFEKLTETMAAEKEQYKDPDAPNETLFKQAQDGAHVMTEAEGQILSALQAKGMTSHEAAEVSEYVSRIVAGDTTLSNNDLVNRAKIDDSRVLSVINEMTGSSIDVKEKSKSELKRQVRAVIDGINQAKTQTAEAIKTSAAEASAVADVEQMVAETRASVPLEQVFTPAQQASPAAAHAVEPTAAEQSGADKFMAFAKGEAEAEIQPQSESIKSEGNLYTEQEIRDVAEEMGIPEAEATALIKNFGAMAKAKGIDPAKNTEEFIRYSVDEQVENYVNVGNITDEQKLARDILKASLADLGIKDVVLVTGDARMVGSNGSYVGGVVTINADRINTQTYSGIAWTVGHEIVHAAEDADGGRKANGVTVRNAKIVNDIFDVMRVLADAGAIEGRYAEITRDEKSLAALIDKKKNVEHRFLMRDWVDENGVFHKGMTKREAERSFNDFDARAEIAADFLGSMLGHNFKHESEGRFGSKFGTSDIFAMMEETAPETTSWIQEKLNSIRDRLRGYDAKTAAERKAKATMQRHLTKLSKELAEAISKGAQNRADAEQRGKLTEEFAEARNSVAPPFREGTEEFEDFVDSLSSRARETFDTFYAVHTIGANNLVPIMVGSGKKAHIKASDITQQYMLPSEWNKLCSENEEFGRVARMLADALPANVKSNANLNDDGTFNETPFEKEFKMERSFAQHIVDGLMVENASSEYVTIEINGEPIRVSNKDAIQAVGGEAYRRALVDVTRSLYKEGKLPTRSISGLSKDNWGTMGFLATNGKTGASGDFTTLCPQMYFNRGCFYCYRRAALTTGTNNKLTGQNVWYTGEILRLKAEDVEMLNNNGGLRIQSFGDWMEHYSGQLADVLADAETVGLQVKIITKEPSMIETVALLKEQGLGKNLYFNLSADYVIEEAGDIADENFMPMNPNRPFMRRDGKLYWKRAMTVEEAARYREKYPWVNTRIAATNLDEFIYGLRDPNVDVVTGYHGNIRQYARVSSATGETLLDVEALGDAGMPRFSFDGKVWSIEFEGKTSTHKRLAHAIEDAGLQMEYYTKTCCITGRCASCNGKCGKLAKDFWVKNATNRDAESVAYWQEHMESAAPNPSLLESMEDAKFSVDDMVEVEGQRYSYENLIRKPPMRITIVEDRIIPTKGKKLDMKPIVQSAKEKANIISRDEFTQNYIDIPDIGGNVLLKTDGLKHGLTGNKTNGSTMSTAEVTGDIAEILHNSIAINELRPRNESEGMGSYVLIGYGRKAGGQEYLVRSQVQYHGDNKSISQDIEIYNVLYSAKAKKIAPQVMSSHTGNPAASHSNSRGTEISIAELLEIVKDNYPEFLSRNTLEHFNMEGYPQHPDAKFSVDDGEYAAPMYSKLQREIEAFKGDRIGASSAVSYLRGKGVKAEEIKWSGIETYLEGKKSVNKQELLDWLKANELTLTATVLGGENNDYYHLRIPAMNPETGEVIADWADFENQAYELAEMQGYDWNDVRFDEYEGWWQAYINDPETGLIIDLMEINADAHNDTTGETHWESYTTGDANNYREILWKMPQSDYSNRAMGAHWDGEVGVVVHARIDDQRLTDGSKALFIEEIQSDWHNEGAQMGYADSDATMRAYEAAEEADGERANMYNDLFRELEAFYSEYGIDTPRAAAEQHLDMAYNNDLVKIFNDVYKFPPKLQASLDRYFELDKKAQELSVKVSRAERGGVPDAPYAKTYHEYALKNLLRMAAEEGYDALAWTPAYMQSERWSDEYAEGYRIEYDQDIPKFLNKYGKQWGAKVGKTNLKLGSEHTDIGREIRELEADKDVWVKQLDEVDESERAFIQHQIDYYDRDIDRLKRRNEVWAIPITKQMRDSVLYEGQPRFSVDDSVATDEESKAVIRRLKTEAMYAKYSNELAPMTPERFKSVYQDSVAKGSPDYAKSYIAWVSPFDYIYATTTSRQSRDTLSEEAGELDLEKLQGYEMPIWLSVNMETGEIIGHEGRHRMLALEKAGVEKVAIVIKAMNTDRTSSKPISRMRLTGQSFLELFPGYTPKGADFTLHDALPLSERYGETAYQLFAANPKEGFIRYSVDDTTEAPVKEAEAPTEPEMTPQQIRERDRAEALRRVFTTAREIYGDNFDKMSEDVNTKAGLERLSKVFRPAASQAQAEQRTRDDLRLQREREREAERRREMRKAFNLEKQDIRKEEREKARIDKMAALAVQEQKLDDKWKARMEAKVDKVKAQAEERLRIKMRKADFIRAYENLAAEIREKKAKAEGKRKAAEERRRGNERISEQRVLSRTTAKEARRILSQSRNTDRPDYTNSEVETLRQLRPDDVSTEQVTTLADKLRNARKRLYRVFVNQAQTIDNFSKLQIDGVKAGSLVNMIFGSASTIETIYQNGLVARDGTRLGNAMKEVFLVRNADGSIDQEKQAILQDYMLFVHNIDRMSFSERALARVEAMETQHPWLVDIGAKEFAYAAGLNDAETETTGTEERRTIVREYAKALADLRKAQTDGDKPIFADKDGKPVSAETSREIVARYEEEHPWLKEKAEGIYEWWDSFMREWAVGNTLSAEAYDTWKQMYPHYVPTYRMNEGGPEGAIQIGPVSASINDLYKAAKGSTKPVKNIEESFSTLVRKIVDTSRKNELLRNIIDTAMLDTEGVFGDFAIFDWDGYYESNPEYGEAMENAAWLNGDSISAVESAHVEAIEELDGGYRITAYGMDGGRYSAWVSKEMYRALVAVTNTSKLLGEGANTLTRIGSKLTTPMKSMITGYNPNFAIRNVMRDIPTAIVNGVSGFAFPKYYARALAQIKGNSEAWQQFQALGGTHFGYYGMSTDWAARMEKKPGLGAKALDKLGAFSEITESATRFAEYLATIDKLGDTYEGRVQGIKNAAEVTVDFSRKGEYGKLANAWIPYWNPAVQGIDKLFRQIFDNSTSVKQKFTVSGVTLARGAIISVLPELLQYLLLKALGDYDEWEKLSDRMKDSYFCIPIPGEHKFLKIPKTREWGTLLGTPLMRMLEGFNGRSDPFENYVEDALLANFSVSGVVDAIGISTIIDLRTNKDFAGRDIVPYAYQEASASKQYDADTSAIAYGVATAWNKSFAKIAEALGKEVELSPMQLDYIINDYCGDFYYMLAQMVPVGLFDGSTSLKEIFGGILGSMEGTWVGDNRYSNYYTGEYYDILDYLDRSIADEKLMNPEDYTNSYVFKLDKAFNEAYGKQLSELNKQAAQLPDGEEKDATKEQIADLAFEAVEWFRNESINNSDDPFLRVSYGDFSDDLQDALIDLDGFSGDYYFKPSPSTSKSYTDPHNKGKEYVLTEEQYAQYKTFYMEAYDEIMTRAVKSYQYKRLSDEEKAEYLDEARDAVHEKAKEELFTWLRCNGVKSTYKAD